MRYTRLLLALLVWTLAALPAVAQNAPKIPNAPEPDKGWMGTVIGIFLVFCVGVASFMTPKRGHQD